MNTSYSFAIEVTPSDSCYLQEALYWVAFGRLPYEDRRSFLDGAAREWGSDDYKTYFPFLDGRLEDEEAELAGIYADPRSHWCMPISMMISDSFETVLDRRSRWGQDNDEENQTDYQEKTRKIYDDLQEWAKLDFEKAIEFPAAKLFVALREGLIETWGKLLPDTDVATALKSIQDTGKTLEGLDYVKILPEFWSLQSIYWEESAARNDTQHFCQIHCMTHEVLKAFPLDKLARAPLYNVEKCGSFLILLSQKVAVSAPEESGFC